MKDVGNFTMLSLSIVIVNWNAGHQLRDCISSIGHMRQDGFVLSEVLIVDNGSSDDSLEHIEELGVPVAVIRNSENRGFAAACNQGARVAFGDYLLFLNPDARLFDKSLSVPIAFMESPENMQVGICGIQLIDESGRVSRSCARFPTLGAFVAQVFGIDKIPRLRKLSHHMAEWDHTASQKVDHVIGAFFLVRRIVFEQVSGFDERFFVYLEDLDFSLRARQEGWSSIYLADAQAFHAGGGTSRHVKATRLFYSLRSRLLYGFKHFSTISAWTLLLVTLLIEPITRIVFTLIRGAGRDALYTLQGYGMLFREIPTILHTAWQMSGSKDVRHV